MSKYIVTNSSYFEPFTYDELAKPIQQMTEAHNAAADAYDQISLETEAIGRYITENPGDEQAKALYDNYINKLNVLKDNLWNRGYSMGTRRDLSAARAAYASDITRLQTAIQTRQNRSNEYWKARHDHPELVAGFDPGLSGLDNYLNNENYGNDWFSYNGNNFAAEVATEAKARAAELMSLTAGASDVPGYLMQIQKSGFTNEQINNAGVLARMVLNGEAKLNDVPESAEELLASVLISRLNSTGANPNAGGNLSASEFDRLFNYGMLGLSQGVGDLNKKYIDDKVWDARTKMAIAAASRTPKDDDNPTPSVHREPISFSIEAPDADKKLSGFGSIYDAEQFSDGKTVQVNLPDGQIAELHNPNEARDLLRSEKAKNFEASTGMDVTRGSSRKKEFKQTGTYKGAPIMAEKASVWDWVKGDVGIGDTVVKQKVNGKWMYHAQLTDLWNQAVDSQKDFERQIEALNPGKKVSEYGFTSKEAFKTRKENPQIPAGVPDSDIPYVMASLYPVGDYLGIPIIHNDDDDDLRTDMANNIAINYDTKQGKGKTGINGFYQVSDDGITIGKTNVAAGRGGLSNVFALDNDGNIKPASIRAIAILPQDIKNGRVNVRLKTTKGTFVTDISSLGTDLDFAMNPNVRWLIERAMLPISNAKDVLDVNNNIDMNWEAEMYQLLYAPNNDFHYSIPKVFRADGKYYPATAKEVARSRQLQKELLDGLNDYLRDAISFGIDPGSLYPRRHRSSSSDKATSTLTH